MTDDEADEACQEEIEQLLWAFNTEFLASETGLDEKVFRALYGLCEDANDAVLALVQHTCGLAALVKSAVSADGRGHFLAQYDSDEHESGDLFIYRTN